MNLEKPFSDACIEFLRLFPINNGIEPLPALRGVLPDIWLPKWKPTMEKLGGNQDANKWRGAALAVTNVIIIG